MPRRLFTPVIAMLSVVAVGCGGQERAEPSLTRPCDPKTLRLHGGFQGRFGLAVRGSDHLHVWPTELSAAWRATAGSRVRRGKPIPLPETHSKDVALSDGPRIVTIPVTPNRSGPGFGFEWQGGTCLPKGPISVRVQVPGTDVRLRVAHEDPIPGPRCTQGSGAQAQVFVSLLVADLAGLIIN